MRGRVFVAVAVVAGVVVIGAQSDGPFGLRMGMTKAELEKLVGTPLKETTPGYIEDLKVPKPHPDFESYSAFMSPTYGLCKLNARGKLLAINVFGDQLRSAFADIAKALEDKYGRPKRLDMVRPGSIWKEPEDWSMALSKKERTLAAWWEGHGVVLTAVGLDREIRRASPVVREQRLRGVPR